MFLHLSKTKFLVCIIILTTFLFQGCSSDTGEIEKTILEHDPSFQKILDKRNGLHKRLDEKRTEFLKKKEEIDVRINILQEQKRQLENEYSVQTDDVKCQIQPEKRVFQKSIIELEYSYKQKKETLRSIENDIKEINSLMKKKDVLALTPEEMKVWNDRLSMLVEKKEAQISEKNKLKKEIEITKLKIKVFN
ncbi:MAG: hypothetical protein ABIH09_02845 [Candidatus Omnitrophota bacterium]